MPRPKSRFAPYTALSDQDYRYLAEQCAGNWKKWQYIWWEKPAQAEDYAILPLSHRDSRLTDQSNEAAILAEMDRYLDGQTAYVQESNHWLVGHMSELVCRVYTRHRPDESGQRRITAAFKVWCEIQSALADYGLLDEEDRSRRELENTYENIKEQARNKLNGLEPEDYVDQMWRWFDEHEPQAIAPRDGSGGYPSDEEIDEALLYLGWLDIGRCVPAMVRLNWSDDEIRLYLIDLCEELGENPHDFAEWIEPRDPLAHPMDSWCPVSLGTKRLPFKE
jgi:hypothetical protein